MSKKKDQLSSGNKKLKDFDIKINEFGEIVSSLPIEKLNSFLDKNVKDKKLEHLHQEEE